MTRERAHPLATGDRLQSVTRALAVLDLLATEPVGMTAKGIAGALELRVPTVYHLLNSLAATGYIARDPATRLFALGPRIPHLNQSYLSRGRPNSASIPSLQALAQTTGETVTLSRLIGDDAVSVMHLLGSKPTAIRAGYIGFAVPAHLTAAGRVLLAAAPTARLRQFLEGPYGANAETMYGSAAAMRAVLRQSRRDGYVVDANDTHPDLCCIAVPIVGPDDVVAEAMAVVVTPASYQRQSAALLGAVRAMARTAGDAVAWPPPASLALGDMELGLAAQRAFGFPE